MRKIFFFFVIYMISIPFCYAGVCGDPPPLTNTTLKGDLKGKAKLLSKYFGGAELSGKIETTSTEVISNYPNADRVIADQYLLYQMCLMLMDDNKMSTPQKLDELRKMRRELSSATENNCASFPLVGKHYGDTYVPSDSPNCPGKLFKGRDHYALGDRIEICSGNVRHVSQGERLSHPKGSDCGTVGSRDSTWVQLKSKELPLHVFSNCIFVSRSLHVLDNGCSS